MKAKILSGIDLAFAIVFAILFVIAIASVAHGAWWHALTAVISGIISHRLFEDAVRFEKKEEK